MGRDIFACLERCFTSSTQWEFLAADVYIGRHYTLFAILVGDQKDQEHGIASVGTPRGLPRNLSYGAELAFARWEKGDDEEDGAQESSDQLAATLVDEASYSYLTYDELVHAQQIFSETEDDVYRTRKIPVGRERPPDAHVLVEEEGFVHVEEKVRGRNGPHLDVKAILAYLKVYEDSGYKTRMVFGFD